MTMHTPAAAIARQLATRHWRGGVAAIATLLGTVAAAPAIVTLLPLHYALLVSFLPLIGVFGFFMNALLFVDDVGSLSSGYPRRMFSLPVPSRTLVIWPMLYGSAAVAVLWVAAAWLVYRPWDSRVPVLLPALGLAALMAWFQAISWSPLHPSWLRIPAAVVTIGVCAGIAPGLQWMGSVSDRTIAALLSVASLAAYPVALAGVASARRGDSWRAWPERLKLWRAAARPDRRPFRSAFEAQLWYEWRCHGLVLPVAVAGILLILLPTVSVSERAFRQGAVARFLLIGLSLSVIVATTAPGAVVARLAPFWAWRRRDIPIVVTRPMTSGGVVAAKFGMAAASVLLAWAVTLIGLATLIVVEGRAEEVAELWGAWRVRYPGWRAVPVVTLGAVSGLALTWRQLTDFVPSALTGRAWIGNLAAAPMVIFGLLIAPVMIWSLTPAGDLPRLLAALPFVVAFVSLLKVLIASWAFREAIRRGLIGARALSGIMALWLVLVASAVGLAALTLPAWLAAETRVAAMVGIASFVPLARFALAPLALDWNRHG